jgi:hypothetical protein
VYEQVVGGDLPRADEDGRQEFHGREVAADEPPDPLVVQ